MANDFTKEELEDIRAGFDEYWLTLSCNRELLNKIDAMIDNYPETCDLCNRENCQECPCR